MKPKTVSREAGSVLVKRSTCMTECRSLQWQYTGIKSIRPATTPDHAIADEYIKRNHFFSQIILYRIRLALHPIEERIVCVDASCVTSNWSPNYPICAGACTFPGIKPNKVIDLHLVYTRSTQELVGHI